MERINLFKNTFSKCSLIEDSKLDGKILSGLKVSATLAFFHLTRKYAISIDTSFEAIRKPGHKEKTEKNSTSHNIFCKFLTNQSPKNSRKRFIRRFCIGKNQICWNS